MDFCSKETTSGDGLANIAASAPAPPVKTL